MPVIPRWRESSGGRRERNGDYAAGPRRAIDRLIPQIAYHGSVAEDRRIEFRDRALEGLIDYELKYQDAVKRGMKPDKKLVKKQWNGVRDQFPSKKEYRKALESAGLTEDEWNALIEKRVLVDQVTDKVVIGPSEMSDEAVKQYYDGNTEKFRQPESVRFRYIATKEERRSRKRSRWLRTDRISAWSHRGCPRTTTVSRAATGVLCTRAAWCRKWRPSSSA